MLVSHRKQFIFTKTSKTAGTSVESYFEQYCMPPGEWQKAHSRNEYVSEAGIIGYRGDNRRGSTWYNHMPAKEIRRRVGEDVWNHYFKFTVIRNPFDKLISGFHFFENIRRNYGFKKRTKVVLNRILKRGKPMDRVTGKTDVERFRFWIREGGSLIDRDKYLINGEECVDYFIRFEELHEDIEHVCKQISIPFEPEHIPEFKKGVRGSRLRIRDYYDDETIEIVKKVYAWELERFSYDLPE